MLSPLRLGVVALLVLLPAISAAEKKKDLTKDQIKVLDGITPQQGFAYFSGHDEKLNNHPALYAGREENGDACLYVVGVSFYKVFKIKEFDKAMSCYKALLKQQRYPLSD